MAIVLVVVLVLVLDFSAPLFPAFAKIGLDSWLRDNSEALEAAKLCRGRGRARLPWAEQHDVRLTHYFRQSAPIVLPNP